MKTILILYVINSFLFILPLFRDFMDVVNSPNNDKQFYNKLGMLVFSCSMLAAMWLCYFAIKEAAWFFFAVAIAVDLRVYFINRKK